MIGSRAIGGYPLERVRELIDHAQSLETKFDAVIAQSDVVEMTPDVMAQMTKRGYSEAELLKLKTDGFRYSPSRNSLISPVMSSDDEDFD